MLPDLIKRMGRLAHFKGLSEAELEAIIAAGHMRQFPAGSTLFSEDEPCTGLFVLVAGQVHLYKLGPDGRENIMAVLDPVTMFNEVAVLDGGTNAATAVAALDSTVWHSSCGSFQSLLQRFPQIGLGLLPILASRNRLLVTLYEDLSFRSVQARTAKLLLDLSDHGRHTINRRENTIGEMAARISTVPENISRTLSHFRKMGFIASTRATIDVRNPDALGRLALIAPYFMQRWRAE